MIFLFEYGIHLRFCNFLAKSSLFLRSFLYWTSSLTFQLDAICWNPYLSQIKSSRYLQSEGSTSFPLYCG